MQEKIDRFNAAFVDMAVDYVERLRLKIVQASVITVAEKRAGTARIDEQDWKIQLPDQVRIADCLAVPLTGKDGVKRFTYAVMFNRHNSFNDFIVFGSRQQNPPFCYGF